MTTKRVMISILIVMFAWGFVSCGRGGGRAGNTQGGQIGANLAAEQTIDPGQLTPQPQQPSGQPTALPQATPANTPEPLAVEPTSPPEQPAEVPPVQPAATEVAIPPMGDTAEALRGAWSQAYQLPAGVPFAVTITEAQVEAMIAEAMAKSGYGSNVSSIDVTLNNGQIGVAYAVTLSQKVGPKTVNASGTVTVIFNVAIDTNGKLALTVASATVSMASGPQISIPPEMLTALNMAVSEAITGASGSAEAEVTLTELVISGGTMTVKGYVTP
jgi:hypothetical protein